MLKWSYTKSDDSWWGRYPLHLHFLFSVHRIRNDSLFSGSLQLGDDFGSEISLGRRSVWVEDRFEVVDHFEARIIFWIEDHLFILGSFWNEHRFGSGIILYRPGVIFGYGPFWSCLILSRAGMIDGHFGSIWIKNHFGWWVWPCRVKHHFELGSLRINIHFGSRIILDQE